MAAQAFLLPVGSSEQVQYSLSALPTYNQSSPGVVAHVVGSSRTTFASIVREYEVPVPFQRHP